MPFLGFLSRRNDAQPRSPLMRTSFALFEIFGAAV
jgi:hypothetical protein